MVHLIIIGAGGMGREVYWLATQCKGYKTEYEIKGFLDYEDSSWNTNVYPPIIGIETSYVIQENDRFVCSIGNVQIKKKICEVIISKGGIFINLIHPTAIINPRTTIGYGCLVFPYALTGSESIIGNNVLLQSFSGVAHDCQVGDYSRIDVQVLLIGGVKIGNCVTVHTGAVLNHFVVVEDDAIVGATSFVIKKVKKGTTVFGNPARELL